MASERKPRLCVMTKGEQGYGFHLHGEKGKTGQFIRKVEPDSSAEAAGLRAGDRVVAVNGVNVEREAHHQVVQRIKAVENETRLLVVDQETHDYLRNLRLTATEEMAIPGEEPPPPFSPPDPTSPSKDKLEDGRNGSAMLESMLQRSTSCQVPKRTRRLPSSASKKVNGVNIEGMRHSEVVAFIKKGGDETWLLVVDPDADEYFKMKGMVPAVSHVKDYDGPSVSNGSHSPLVNGGSTSHSIRSTTSDRSHYGKGPQQAGDERGRFADPFAEIGLSATAAEEKRKLHAKEKRRAPQMDWMKKYELFSNF
ncbi:Na(+)/H(+) exchange regulatory cofactor NHE-RF2 isoform X3 [Syngnathus typhle]|uniref:Na(+)/H(+) exchange regulatory cofactor NHE-RF2 isoform X3 n=1 Tax=Syngnathus typhle TaxID=161592 RepID=UPI002A6AC8A2|nr:Na(+)/H(+) exchange regulatory cofactor NHE-RF2 isoform X3 [Syngnathus typhle]